MSEETVNDVCMICGKTFERKSWNQKMCGSEYCLGEYKKIHHSTHKRKKKKKSNPLVDMAVEAREHGMSYGKYVAMMQAKKYMNRG